VAFVPRSPSHPPNLRRTVSDDYSTIEVARLLGMAVRSVQMMVDRGELDAWKTPGGHRRISRASVERWRASRQQRSDAPPRRRPPAQRPCRRRPQPPRRAARCC
jgi:excisionase family DNA binding protein